MIADRGAMMDVCYTPILLPFTQAQQLAIRLNAESEDGWTYQAECVVGSDYCRIAVYDESRELVEYL